MKQLLLVLSLILMCFGTMQAQTETEQVIVDSSGTIGDAGYTAIVHAYEQGGKVSAGLMCARKFDDCRQLEVGGRFNMVIMANNDPDAYQVGTKIGSYTIIGSVRLSGSTRSMVYAIMAIQ